VVKNPEINLFWYSIDKFRKKPSVLSKTYIKKLILREKEKENYGDLLSKYIIEKITKTRTNWYSPKSKNLKVNLLAIGSILNYADEKSIVWGSGIIDRKHAIANADFRAVRGPLTRERLLELGYSCPKIYGDPALLLPKFYKPDVDKQFEIGIIPHHVDYNLVSSIYRNQPGIKVINLLTRNIEKTTEEILGCERIISSSLHGLIVAHAYGIPAVWVKFSNNLYGDGVKFEDYLISVNLRPYTGEYISGYKSKEELIKVISKVDNLPVSVDVQKIQGDLLLSCPF